MAKEKESDTLEIPFTCILDEDETPKSTDCLPTPDTVSYYVLEKERKVFIDYDIDSDIACIERLIFRWNMRDKGKPREERKPIWIYLNSYGGDADFCWSFIDVILASATPVYTVNLGFAWSAAGLIFLAGEKRFMLPRAKVVIHEGSASMSGDSTKVLDASDSYRKEIKRMKEFILERTSIPSALLSRKKNNDWELNAELCKEYGVCTQVITNLEEVI